MQSESDLDDGIPPSGQGNPYANPEQSDDLESPEDSNYAPSDNEDSRREKQITASTSAKVHHGPHRWHSRQEGERKNRFSGSHRTWMRLTDADRQVAASLDYLQNTDLGIHLYNAFMLKKWLGEQGSSWQPPSHGQHGPCQAAMSLASIGQPMQCSIRDSISLCLLGRSSRS